MILLYNINKYVSSPIVRKVTVLNNIVADLCLENAAVTGKCFSVLRASLQVVQFVLRKPFEGSEAANFR